jgi:hypothetical protein
MWQSLPRSGCGTGEAGGAVRHEFPEGGLRFAASQRKKSLNDEVRKHGGVLQMITLSLPGCNKQELKQGQLRRLNES